MTICLSKPYHNNSLREIVKQHLYSVSKDVLDQCKYITQKPIGNPGSDVRTHITYFLSEDEIPPQDKYGQVLWSKSLK